MSEKEDEFIKSIETRKLVRLLNKLSPATQKRLEILGENMVNGTITIEYILNNLIRLCKIIEKIEKTTYSYEGLQKTRLWILKNMYLVLCHKYINPIIADDEVCEYLEDHYTYILEIYHDYRDVNDLIKNMINDTYNTEDLQENLRKRTELFLLFIVIDTCIKNQYKSENDISSFILNNNIYFINNGGKLVRGDMQSKD